MRKFSFYKNGGEEVRRDDSCGGRPKPGGPVANEGKRSTGNVGNGFGSGQHGSRSNRMLHQISSIGWGDGGVPGGIGTYPVDNMYLADLFLVRRCFVQRL